MHTHKEFLRHIIDHLLFKKICLKNGVDINITFLKIERVKKQNMSYTTTGNILNTPMQQQYQQQQQGQQFGGQPQGGQFGGQPQGGPPQGGQFGGYQQPQDRPKLTYVDLDPTSPDFSVKKFIVGNIRQTGYRTTVPIFYEEENKIGNIIFPGLVLKYQPMFVQAKQYQQAGQQGGQVPGQPQFGGPPTLPQGVQQVPGQQQFGGPPQQGQTPAGSFQRDPDIPSMSFTIEIDKRTPRKSHEILLKTFSDLQIHLEEYIKANFSRIVQGTVHEDIGKSFKVLPPFKEFLKDITVAPGTIRRMTFYPTNPDLIGPNQYKWSKISFFDMKDATPDGNLVEKLDFDSTTVNKYMPSETTITPSLKMATVNIDFTKGNTGSIKTYINWVMYDNTTGKPYVPASRQENITHSAMNAYQKMMGLPSPAPGQMAPMTVQQLVAPQEPMTVPQLVAPQEVMPVAPQEVMPVAPQEVMPPQMAPGPPQMPQQMTPGPPQMPQQMAPGPPQMPQQMAPGPFTVPGAQNIPTQPEFTTESLEQLRQQYIPTEAPTS